MGLTRGANDNLLLFLCLKGLGLVDVLRLQNVFLISQHGRAILGYA